MAKVWLIEGSRGGTEPKYRANAPSTRHTRFRSTRNDVERTGADLVHVFRISRSALYYNGFRLLFVGRLFGGWCGSEIDPFIAVFWVFCVVLWNE